MIFLVQELKTQKFRLWQNFSNIRKRKKIKKKKIRSLKEQKNSKKEAETMLRKKIIRDQCARKNKL